MNAYKQVTNRLFIISSVYLRCEVKCYDEKLYLSLDRMIDELKKIERECPLKDILLQVVESRAKLLELKIKLLEIKQDEGIIQNSATNQAHSCVFCKGDHLSEFCELSVKSRTNRLKRRKLCFRCLDKFDVNHRCAGTECAYCYGNHHSFICRQLEHINKKYARAQFEPAIPSESVLLRVSKPIVHPSSLFSTLFYYTGQENDIYSPTVTVYAHSEVQSMMTRAYVNFNVSSGSFVSYRLLSMLQIEPIPLRRPIPLTTINDYGNMECGFIYSYVVLELSSLFKPQFRYKRVFYATDLPLYIISHASGQMSKFAADCGVTLSNELWIESDIVDILIGSEHRELIGLSDGTDFIQFGFINESAKAYYTHFGYLLMGSKFKYL